MKAENPAPELPWWSQYVAQNRDYCEGVALCFGDAFDEIYYIVFSKLNPVYTVFLVCTRADVQAVPAFESAADHNVDFDPWTRSFDWSACRYLTDLDMPRGDDIVVSVLEGLKFAGLRVETSREPMEFDDFLRLCPETAPNERNPNRRRPVPRMSAEAIDALKEDFPWLTEQDLQAYAPRGGGHGGGGHGGLRGKSRAHFSPLKQCGPIHSV